MDYFYSKTTYSLAHMEISFSESAHNKLVKALQTSIVFCVNHPSVKKVIPTQPIVVSLPAPTGAKPGDSVQLEVPDGVTANKMEVSQKLITVIVKADGTVDITVFPDVLRNLLVIVIIIADQSTN